MENMLEKILYINDNEAKLQIVSQETANQNLMNMHLIFDDGERKILGEIDEIDSNIIHIQFLGEFKDNDFIPGVIKKPKLTATVRLITSEELDIVLAKNDPRAFCFGSSVLYDNAPVNVNIDALYNGHIAIFGNTGAGKSYGVSKLLQSLFYDPRNIAINSTIFMFDVHGEYNNAFKDLNAVNSNYHYKLYTSNPAAPTDNIISLPIWLMDIEDIAALLGATDYSQLAILEKAIFILSILSQRNNLTNQFKNHIIAKSIQALMYSNLSSSKIRNNIFEILSIVSTNELNLNAIVPGIGYTREFKKCFDIGKNGTFAENVLVSGYIEQYINDDLERQVTKTIGKCNLEDLEDALNFVIVSENILSNDRFYNSAMMLKMKLHSLVIGGYNKYFEYPEYVNIEGYIRDLVIDKSTQKKAQFINFNIEGLSSYFSFFVARTISKLLYNFVSLLRVRASMPIHLMLEEAHHFTMNDEAFDLGENVFEKIAKEGRKYGIILTLISQRPTELSETVLSQCSSFLLFRTNHPRDLEYMKKAIPNINTDIIDKQRSIQPGYCVGLGKAFKIPMILNMEKPNPIPKSSNAPIFDIWSGGSSQS